MNISSPLQGLSRVLTLCATLVIIIDAPRAAAQTPEGAVEIGGQLSILRISEFEITDVGTGVEASWHLTPGLAIDGTLAWFPDEHRDRLAILSRRIRACCGTAVPATAEDAGACVAKLPTSVRSAGLQACLRPEQT